MADPFIVITGCPRSGTAYITVLLNALGVKIGHEAVREDGIASWLLAARSNKGPYGPGFSKLGTRPLAVVHQVREPLATIASMTTLLGPSWKFAASHIDCAREPSLVRMAMKLWVGWNALTEKIAEKRYRIEEIDTVLPELLKFFNRAPAGNLQAVLADIPRNVHTRPHDTLTWQDLEREDQALSERVREMSKTYGY